MSEEKSIIQDNLSNSTFAISVIRMFKFYGDHIYGLVPERRNSIANALGLRLSCTNPSIYIYIYTYVYIYIYIGKHWSK